MKAQSSVEYIMLIGLLLVIIIPLFYYGTSRQKDMRLEEAQSVIDTISSSANNVYHLGPGNKIENRITIPKGVISTSVEDRSISIVFREAETDVDLHKEVTPLILGEIPVDEGTYTIITESTDSGVCVYQKGNREDDCYCFLNDLKAPVFGIVQGSDMIVCSKDKTTYSKCDDTNLRFMDNIKSIKTICTDNENVKMVRYDIYFNNGAYPIHSINAVRSGNEFTFGQISEINLSKTGRYNITATCYDDCMRGNQTSVAFNIETASEECELRPYIRIEGKPDKIYLNDPENIITTTKGNKFTITTGVDNVGGTACNNTEVALDPSKK